MIEKSYSFMEKHNFLSKDIEALRDIKIYEYDLKDAGFSILTRLNVFPDDLKGHLESLDKFSRNVIIGKLSIEHPELNNIILDNMARARKKLAELNDLDHTDILSIKKDAIFTIDKKLEHQVVFDTLYFELDNEYTSYYYINGIEFYINSFTKDITVKGMGNDIVNLHNGEDGFLTYMRDLMIAIEGLNDKWDRVRFLRLEQEKYINGDLPIGVYKEFRALKGKEHIAKFKLKQREDSRLTYYVTESFDFYFDEVDISYNYLTYILPFVQMSIQ